jgi:hypothetical protein
LSGSCHFHVKKKNTALAGPFLDKSLRVEYLVAGLPRARQGGKQFRMEPESGENLMTVGARALSPTSLTNPRVLTVGGALCLLPSLAFWTLWIRVSSMTHLPTYAARVTAFLGYFPSGFSVRTLSFLALATELLAFILSGAGVLSPDKVQKGINIAVMAISVTLTLLSAFQLL